MNVFEEEVVGDTSPLKKLEQALQNEAIGGKQKKEADFAEAYLVIEQHLGRKLPVKVVLKMFCHAYGYIIHAPRFRQMLDAERKRRAEVGDLVKCTGCGQPLSLAMKAAENVGDTEGNSYVR